MALGITLSLRSRCVMRTLRRTRRFAIESPRSSSPVGDLGPRGHSPVRRTCRPPNVIWARTKRPRVNLLSASLAILYSAPAAWSRPAAEASSSWCAWRLLTGTARSSRVVCNPPRDRDAECVKAPTNLGQRVPYGEVRSVSTEHARAQPPCGVGARAFCVSGPSSVLKIEPLTFSRPL